MFITNHALAGAAIGLMTRRPATAFAAGVASHLGMDMILHWGDEISWTRFVEIAKVDGTLGLGVCSALLGFAPRGSRAAVAAGIAGACLIDMDKPGRHFFGRSPFPAAVDRFHGRLQNERPIGGLVEVFTAATLVATCAGLRGLAAPARRSA